MLKPSPSFSLGWEGWSFSSAFTFFDPSFLGIKTYDVRVSLLSLRGTLHLRLNPQRIYRESFTAFLFFQSFFFRVYFAACRPVNPPFQRILSSPYRLILRENPVPRW